MQRPDVVLFDVNETLSDLAPMARHLEAVGVPGHLARVWFASTLRDGIALAAVSAAAPFADIAAGTLRGLLAAVELPGGLDAAVEEVLGGFADLDVHPDVPGGVAALADAGVGLATLSNGAASVAEGLLGRAGILDRFERLLSVEDAGIWKPAPGSYRYGLEQCAVEADRAMLVAVHPWDLEGASRAGLRTAWLNRDGQPWPGHFRAPDVEVVTLPALAEELGR
jgi:2-haloacid dehalogenase